MPALAERIIFGALDVAKDILGNRLKEANKRLADRSKLSSGEPITGAVTTTSSSLHRAIQAHLEQVQLWASATKFADLPKAKSISQIYVDLDTYLTPLRQHIDKSEQSNLMPLLRAIEESDSHIVILGQVGAGKTTSAKRLCAPFFLGTGNTGGQAFPILLRFREFGETPKSRAWPILSALSEAIPLRFSLKGMPKKDKGEETEREKEEEEAFRYEVQRDLYCGALDELRPLIILDGFDELPDRKLREAAVKEFRYLCSKLTKARIVLTSRVGDFVYEIERTDTFQIAPLSLEQINLFARKWLIQKRKVDHFLSELQSSPYAGTAMKPLTLAHLCAIYERIGSIPEKPITVYKKIVNLLLEEWDEQNSVKRRSAYARFSPDRKFDFLCNLSFQLTSKSDKSAFSAHELAEAYGNVCGAFGLPPHDATKVARELETHTGLFIESGFKTYEFAHKSLQEYLCAEYIVKLPSLSAIGNGLFNRPSELAVATSISSDAGIYFSTLFLNHIAPRIEYVQHFMVPYISRIFWSDLHSGLPPRL